MPWIVKLDKESDWIGRYAIEWYKRRGNRLRRWSAGRARTARCRSRARRWSAPTASPPAASPARASRAGWARRSASPGCRSRSPRRAPPIRISDPDGATIPATVTHQRLLRPRRREVAFVSSTVDPFAFLSPAATDGAALRTPMERHHLAAGAALEERDGWRIGRLRAAQRRATAWAADVSHYGKLDVRGTAARDRRADRRRSSWARPSRRDGVWTLRLSPDPRRRAVPVRAGRVDLGERIGEARRST